MKIQDLAGKRVCILGFGREGQAALRAIQKYAESAKVTVADKNTELPHTESRISNIEFRVGPNYLQGLNTFDVVIKSPGIPPCPEIEAIHGKMTTSTELFLDSIEESSALVIGVTGSKGKSTTSSLIAAILKEAGRDVHLVGNIGKPAIDLIDAAKRGTIFVHETSSYQLMDLKRSFKIAVITSFFPEHLDYHGSLEAYAEAKKNVCRFQEDSDAVFFPAKDSAAVEIAKAGNGRKIPFLPEDSPVSIENTHLLGAHNLSNIAAAFCVTEELGTEPSDAIRAIKAFRGLPHRLQSLGTVEGLEWVDDAISTTPESTMAALEALEGRIATIILGGQDRGYDFFPLGHAIAARPEITTVILFPGSGPRIREALEQAGVRASLFEATSMEDATRIAKTRTPHEERDDKPAIVLLSTASPSYGMFKNFEEKGERFAALVTKN
jgi:UDP-N-acetylmuramoylalanine--D-glutamate ligase